MPRLEDKYRDEIGHEPPEPPDEYRWQWEYRGTKDERESLLDRLSDDERGPQPTQDESPVLNELALFDADRTVTVRCSVCGATRQPGDERAPDCTVDRDRRAGTLAYRRRPVGCLNTIDPETTPIPF